MQSIVVNGQNLGGVSLIMQPPLTLSGNITVESSGTPAPTDYSTFRIDVPDVTPLPFGGGGGPGGRGGGPRRRRTRGEERLLSRSATCFRAGTTSGSSRRRRQAAGARSSQGQWTLKSVLVAGQDVTDQAID